MGQKINPRALRAKYLTSNTNGWYAQTGSLTNYATKLHMDLNAKRIMKDLGTKLDLVDIQTSINKTNQMLVTIILPYPAYLYLNIGSGWKRRTITQTFQHQRADSLKNALTPVLESTETLQTLLTNSNIPLSGRINVQVKLMKTPYHSPNFLARAIQASLQKRVSLRRAMKIWSQIAMSHQVGSLRIKGVRVKISGRLNGAEMASSEQLSIGKISLQTISAPVDYCCQHYKTPSGMLGIKVWIAGY